MKSLSLMLSLILSALVLTLNVFSQQFTGDKLLKLELHPTKEGIFIAKFYDRQSRKIVEQWEMGTRVTDISSDNFITLLEKGSIYPEGSCYSFHPNRKIESELYYKNGRKVGVQKTYFESGELKMETDMDLFPSNVFTYYYKNGVIRKTETNLGLPVDWNEKTYYDNGQLKSEVNFKRNYIDARYESFYPDGTKKRKAEFNKGALISEKCFDKKEIKTSCNDFIIAPEYYGGWQIFEKDLEKIDFSFNVQNTDTTDFRLLLEIDSLGIGWVREYHLEYADTLKPLLEKWAITLSKFSPARVDDRIENVYLDFTLALSGDRLLWLGEPAMRLSKAFNGFDFEKKWLWYCDYPNPGVDRFFIIAEQMPQFPGGNNALQSFIYDHLHYPKEAKREKIQGTVHVSFVVNEKGSVEDIKVSKSVHYLIDHEATRVIGLLPKWKPAMTKGNPVSVPFTIPINFSLER